MPHACPAEEAGLSPHITEAFLLIQEESCKSVVMVQPNSSFTATLHQEGMASHWARGPAFNPA